ncbi:hypothetical protein H4I96_07996 [Botrytis cinerea]
MTTELMALVHGRGRSPRILTMVTLVEPVEPVEPAPSMNTYGPGTIRVLSTSPPSNVGNVTVTED